MSRRRWFSSRLGGRRYPTENPPPNGGLDGKTIREFMDLGSDGWDRLVAIHEVAHGIVGRAQGMRIANVEVGEGVLPGTSIRVAGRFGLEAQTASSVDVGRCFAAGERGAARWLTEQGLAGPARLWANEVSAASDRVMLEEIAASAGIPGMITYGEPGPEGSHDWGDLRQDADELLNRQWPGVLRAADALQERRWLTGDDLDDLLGRA